MPNYLVRCSTKSVPVGRVKRIAAENIGEAIKQARVIQQTRGAACATVTLVPK